MDKSFIEDLKVLAEQNSRIEPELYTRYNVKRGLRNSDGTGVLVGLTEIGDVHGYILDEGEKTPDEGRLRYRGIDIRDMVKAFQEEKRFGFEETCFLLLFGKLPTSEELKRFNDLLCERRILPPSFTEDVILKAPSGDIMNKLAMSVLACYSFDSNPEDTSIENVLMQCIDLIARFPVIVAYSYQAKNYYRNSQSLRIHVPKKDLGTAENLLHMVRSDNGYTPLEAELLDLSLVLHAEHGGGNNSTFAVHVVTSSGTDIYSSIAAAVGSLKGPKHGGANIKVMEMIENIKSNVQNWNDEDELSTYLAKLIRKEAYDKTGLIYGLGHAVYTVSDPRAILLKQKATELAGQKGMEDELNLYFNIERLAPEVFASEKRDSKVISANVDFYSGFVYKMLNIPSDLYTPIFAVSRIAGWAAHVIEEIVSGGRIMRPAYKSVAGKREYIPLSER